jgi:hypothetical protein
MTTEQLKAQVARARVLRLEIATRKRELDEIEEKIAHAAEGIAPEPLRDPSPLREGYAKPIGTTGLRIVTTSEALIDSIPFDGPKAAELKMLCGPHFAALFKEVRVWDRTGKDAKAWRGNAAVLLGTGQSDGLPGETWAPWAKVIPAMIAKNKDGTTKKVVKFDYSEEGGN